MADSIERLDALAMPAQWRPEAAGHISRYSLVLPLCAGRTCLDVGTGAGYGAALMGRYGAANVLGIDISSDAVFQASQVFAAATVKFDVCAAENIGSSLRSQSFDLITCFEVIEHVDDVSSVLKGIRDCATAGAVIAISCPNDLWYYRDDDVGNPFHKRQYTFDEFRLQMESVLGPCQRWLLGRGIFGYGIGDVPGVDNAVVTESWLTGLTEVEGFQVGQGYYQVSDEQSSFFVGLWGPEEVVANITPVAAFYDLGMQQVDACMAAGVASTGIQSELDFLRLRVKALEEAQSSDGILINERDEHIRAMESRVRELEARAPNVKVDDVESRLLAEWLEEQARHAPTVQGTNLLGGRFIEQQLAIERERAQAADWRLEILLERMKAGRGEFEGREVEFNAELSALSAELATCALELHTLRSSLRRQARLLVRTSRSALRARMARLRAPWGRKSSKGFVAVVHREATVLSLETVGSVMDEAWYRQKHGLGGGADAIAHWIDLGIENGYALSSSHEALVEYQHAAGLVAAQDRDLEWALGRPGHEARGISASFIAEATKSDAYDLLTLDLWDTLIERTRPADAAKLATARRIALSIESADSFCPWDLMEQRVSIEATIAKEHPGGEYELSDVIRRQFAELGVGVDSGIVKDLVALEVADEIAWTHARDEVLSAITDTKMSVAIVSDFYLGESHLRQIVDERLGDLGSVRVFSSCTEGVSKRVDGQLLRKVRDEFGVRPDRHLHVGDNPYSDVEQQVLTGGHAISVSVSSTLPGPGQFSRLHTAEMTMAFLARLETDARLRWREDRDENRDAEAAYVAGARHAFLAVALVAGALEHSWVNGVETVHYLSREGQFLERVHQAIESILRPPGRHALNAVVLEASRRSTFPATLRLPLAESLGYMWAQYRNQSPRAMLVSTGLDPTLYEAELSTVGLGLDDNIEDIARNPGIRKFLEMPNVASDFVREGRRRRDAMRAYMESRSRLSEEFVCVDIGWRGTIQDNICRSLGIARSTGFYIGTFPFLTPQAIGIEKVAVGIDGARGDDYSFVHPPAALELPWTSETPSCVNYDVNDDGVGFAVSDTRVEGASVLRAHYQQGLLDSAPAVAHWMVGHGYTSSMVQDEVASELRRIWETPPEGLADIWFESEHDDTFGALNAEHFTKMGPDESWFDRPISDTVDEYAAHSHWEKGYRKWRPVHALLAIEALARDRD